MSWELEIHHIDVGGAGDATLILAIETIGAVRTTRSMLVDGGLGGAAEQRVNPYLSKIGLEKLDVVLSTHYDADHLDGIAKLLAMRTPRYQDTIVYDQGIPGRVELKTTRASINGEPVFKLSIEGLKTNVWRYFQSIGNRVHPTKNVVSGSLTSPPHEATGLLDDTYLLTRELLWNNPSGPIGAYPSSYSGVIDKDSHAVGTPPEGAPTVTCIAANGYVLNHDGSIKKLLSGVSGELDDNGKSLALEVRFGNFKYYVGGDLTSLQEDGYGSVVLGLRDYLNHGSNPFTRVKAMKASHHGSAHSTSDKFLNQLLPELVVISNGTDNTHNHPDQETLDRIEASPTVKHFFLTGPSFSRNPPMNLGTKGILAGSWTQNADGTLTQHMDGNVVLSVNDSGVMKVTINVNTQDQDDDVLLISPAFSFRNRAETYTF